MGQERDRRERRRLSNHRSAHSGYWVIILSLLAALSLSHHAVRAAELVAAQVTSGAVGYNIRTEVLLAASPVRVQNTLTQYTNLPEFNPNIEKVVMLPQDQEGEARLRMYAKACFFIVCQRYRWVQRVSILPDGQIFALVEPPEGDFYSGWFSYRFVPDGDDCRLILDAYLAPKEGVRDNWFVRTVMRRVLADEAITLANRLENELSQSITSANSQRVSVDNG